VRSMSGRHSRLMCASCEGNVPIDIGGASTREGQKAATGQGSEARGAPNPRWRCRRAPQEGTMACLSGMWRCADRALAGQFSNGKAGGC
jgi:hypothetical protein